MKRFFKWLGLGVATVLFTALLLGLHAWFFKPLSLNVFYARVFLKTGLDDPQLLTSLHILEQFGIKGHQQKLSDQSQAHETKQYDRARDDLATLRSYNSAGMQGDEKLSYQVLENFLAVAVEGERWRYHDYPINPTSGSHNELPSFMLNQHPLDNERDARDYVKRLQGFGVYFAQEIEGLKIREQRGIIPPAFVVEKVLVGVQNFVSKPPVQNPLYAQFAVKLAKLKLGEASQKQILADALAAVDTVVYPAYRDLAAYMLALKPKATTNNGVWALPDGEAYYAYKVREQTTTTLTPDEIHDIGLNEVARIGAEMDRLLTSIGLVEGTIGERMEKLAAQPNQQYPNSDAGRAQALADYQTIIDEVNAGMGAVFDVRPKQGVKVLRVPEFMQDTAPGAYYEAGAMDGSRPGVFFANLREMKDIPRLGMRTLSYHEAVPGHHFQISIAQELTGLPFFRKVLPFTAYAEGWALYAERLAWEQGFEKDTPSNLGRLQAEMFRAVRLVVDTGLHRKRWTREQAIAYMREKTGMGITDVTAEIERYMVWPGQALAYKLGMLKILELREYAKNTLKERFDIKQFHNAILTGGALPMPLLEQRVKNYVAAASTAK